MLCIFSAIYTYVTASSSQVLSRWQQLTLQDMAAQQPNADLVIVADEDALLVQSVPLHDRHDGVTAVMLVGDPSLDAAIVVQRTAGLFCLSCSAQRSCRHAKAISGNTEAVVADIQARESAWANKFAQAFDTSSGRRCVTSISKVSLVTFQALQCCSCA